MRISKNEEKWFLFKLTLVDRNGAISSAIGYDTRMQPKLDVSTVVYHDEDQGSYVVRQSRSSKDELNLSIDRLNLYDAFSEQVDEDQEILPLLSIKRGDKNSELKLKKVTIVKPRIGAKQACEWIMLDKVNK